MTERFDAEVAEVFEISIGELSDSDVFVEKAPWDSLKVLSVISLVDEFYSVALSTNDIVNCKNLSELLEVIKSKGGTT